MMSSTTDFDDSQIGGGSVINYAYTDMPWRLFVKDVYYFFVYAWALPIILSPICRFGSDELDELWPNWPNMLSLFNQLFLALAQLLFLATLPLALLLPIWVAGGLVLIFLAVNWVLCKLVNGPGIEFDSDPNYAAPKAKNAHEQWVFNGVAAGEHWTRSNLNRLALTFGRPVKGIHNRTLGILFDIIECLIQRNLTLATADVRHCYKILRKMLYDPAKSKAVFILHSQGGIEGGLVLDWLLQEMPQELLAKLEVYTFGNAANHFNNPLRHAPRELACRHASSGSPGASPSVAQAQAFGHIEHYAHSTDFVALWGVLHFATNKMGSPQLPRFLGRLFNRSTGRGGHLFNQHYLYGMFPLERDPETGKFRGAAEDNEFMDEPIETSKEVSAMDEARETFDEHHTPSAAPEDASTPSGGQDGTRRQLKVRNVSHLWSYRNGMSPPEKPAMLLTRGGAVRTAIL